MKKIFVMLALMLAVCINVSAQNYTRSGNTFVQTQSASTRTKAEPKKTPYTWQDSKGQKYPIFLSANGSAFVNRVSAKTGKEYRHYLGEEMSREICREMKVEYKGKTKK